MRILVIGASENPERYSNKAIKKLVSEGYEVKAISTKPGIVDNVEFDTKEILYEEIHTVTMYIAPENQQPYYEYVEKLKPKRVIFNPGTENLEFERRLREKKIEAIEACTLVLLSTGQF
jgi:predicted CoA-binding protein